MFTLSIEEVKAALNSKGLKKKASETRSECYGKSLVARRRQEKKDPTSGRGRSKSKSKLKTREIKYFHCHREGHIKKDCPEQKGKENYVTFRFGDAVIVDDYDSADVLTISGYDSGNKWVLDSGCSYHMCPP